MTVATNMTNTATTVSPSAEDIRDIAPPVPIPSGWEWLWWMLAGLALAGLGYALFRWWARRRVRLPMIPTVPAHVRAMQRLQEALAVIAQPKPFVVAVSDAARQYLEERFEFRAPERTTEEFLYELQRTNLLSREQKDSLGDFLQQCDLVKFAKYEPRETELRDLHGAAVRLVEETKPIDTSEPEVATQNS